MKIYPIIFCSLFLLSFQIKATPIPESHANMRDSILNLLNAGEIFAADDLFEQSLLVAKEGDSLINYLNLVKKIGTFWRKSSSPENCIAIYKRGFQESLWRLPNTEKEWNSLAWLYTQLGKVYYRQLGDFGEAQFAYEKAASIFEKNIKNPKKNNVARFVWRQLGNIYTRNGDFPAGESYLKKFIQQMVIDSDLKRATEGHSDLALLYETWEKEDQAYVTYFTGLRLKNHEAISKSTLLLNLGSFSLNQDSIRQSFKYIRQAQKLLQITKRQESYSPRITYLLGVAETRLAGAYQSSENNEQAHAALQNAQSYFQEYFGDTQRREFGKLYNQFGDLFYDMSDFKKAINYYQISLQNVLLNYQPKDEFDLPNATSFYAENTIGENIEGMALAYQAWYETNKNTDLLDKALECYSLINIVEGHLRRNYMYENSKLFNLEESHERSEKAIDLAERLYQMSGDEHYLYRAFTFAEHNRSSLLREALRSTQALNEISLNPEELEREKSLKYDVSKALEERFILKEEGAADSLLQKAEQALLLAKDAQQDWLKELETKHPKYYQFKYADDLLPLKAYQAMLGKEELMLEYFVGKKQLYVFAIDNNEIALHRLPLPNDLTQKILSWRKSIEDYQYVSSDRDVLMEQYVADGHQLYKALLEGVLSEHEEAKELLIIPSGILDLLPFEALLQRSSQEGTVMSELPYLIRDYTIGYSYSASLYHVLKQFDRKGEGMGGFAPDFSKSEAWPNLRCSFDQLQEVDNSWSKELILGTQATKKRFEELAAKYRVLHLATHAQANAEFGDFSFIVFHNEEGGLDSLYAKDLYLEKIEAELVILSACETALGTLYNSEGVISLARAFHYAGARSVVTTLWRINEGANCNVMSFFYDELTKQQTKPAALRNAKLQYLENTMGDGAHPVFWAGFQFSGNPRPVSEASSFVWYLLGGFLAIFFGLRLKKIREKQVLGKQELVMPVDDNQARMA